MEIQVFVQRLRTVAVPAQQIAGTGSEKTIARRTFRLNAFAAGRRPRRPLMRIVAGGAGNIADPYG